MSTNKSGKTTPAASTKPRLTRSSDAVAGQVHSGMSKAATVIALLQRDGGATIAQMMEATAWQKHSIRGFMSGALKKRHGLKVTSVKTDQGRTYRVATQSQS